MKLPDVIWKEIGKDDFIVEGGGYVLRVEQMDEGYWWWSVSLYGKYVAFNEPKANTEAEAKLYAEVNYLRDWIQTKPF